MPTVIVKRELKLFLPVNLLHHRSCGYALCIVFFVC